MIDSIANALVYAAMCAGLLLLLYLAWITS
jgi:hypothetical protein